MTKNKTQIGLYLKDSSIMFIKNVSKANDGLSNNFVANKIIELGIEEYSKKLKKNLELR